MKKIWQLIIIVPILIGIGVGVYISVNKQIEISNDNGKMDSVFGNASSKAAKVTKFYSFGTSLNVEGKIESILKDNFEGIKLVVTDGGDFTEYYTLEASFGDDGALYFKSSKINDAINLDKLNERNVLCFS